MDVARSTALPCECYLLVSLTGNKEGSMGFMVLQARLHLGIALGCFNFLLPPRVIVMRLHGRDVNYVVILSPEAVTSSDA